MSYFVLNPTLDLINVAQVGSTNLGVKQDSTLNVLYSSENDGD